MKDEYRMRTETILQFIGTHVPRIDEIRQCDDGTVAINLDAVTIRALIAMLTENAYTRDWVVLSVWRAYGEQGAMLLGQSVQGILTEDAFREVVASEQRSSLWGVVAMTAFLGGAREIVMGAAGFAEDAGGDNLARHAACTEALGVDPAEMYDPETTDRLIAMSEREMAD